MIARSHGLATVAFAFASRNKRLQHSQSFGPTFDTLQTCQRLSSRLELFELLRLKTPGTKARQTLIALVNIDVLTRTSPAGAIDAQSLLAPLICRTRAGADGLPASCADDSIASVTEASTKLEV